MQPIDEFLSSFPFADATKESYRRILSHLIAECDLDSVTAAGLLKWIDKPGWGNSMRYIAICAARRFLAWAYGASHPALSARLKRRSSKPQRVLQRSKALELLASFDTFSEKGARDLAIAALALDTGLRVSELCRLERQFVDLDAGTLQVVIKGGQWGSGIFSSFTAQYIREYLAMRKDKTPNLFVSAKHPHKALTREGLQTIVKGWGRRIGVKLSPHDFRRTFATFAIMAGAPSRVVQEAGRWSNIAMVEYYTRTLDQSAIKDYFPVGSLKK